MPSDLYTIGSTLIFVHKPQQPFENAKNGVNSSALYSQNIIPESAQEYPLRMPKFL